MNLRSKENNYSLNIDKFKKSKRAIEETERYKPIMQYKNAFTIYFSSLWSYANVKR
jgi:hypothetical protein